MRGFSIIYIRGITQTNKTLYNMRQLRITSSITNRDSPAVEKYLQELSREHLITPEQETALAIRIQAGDEKALEKMVKANLRFVVSVAKQYQHQGLELSDLINNGNLGLFKAAQRFDHTRGFKFISYAVWWIRQSILQAIAETGKNVRLPQNQISVHRKVAKAIMDFEQEFEREPDNYELAEILGMNIDEVIALRSGTNICESLDEPVGEDSDMTFADMLDGDNRADATTSKESLQEDIRRALKTLSVREVEIISAYFRLNGDDSPTLEEIGEKYKLTKERIRQIRERIIEKLRKPRCINILRAHLG